MGKQSKVVQLRALNSDTSTSPLKMPNGLASSIVILTSPKRATPHSITRQQPATPIPAFSLCCSGYFKTMPYPCMNTSTGTNDLPMSTGWSFRTSWSDLIFTTKKRMGLLSSTMPIYLTTRYWIFRERSLLLRHPHFSLRCSPSCLVPRAPSKG